MCLPIAPTAPLLLLGEGCRRGGLGRVHHHQYVFQRYALLRSVAYGIPAKVHIGGGLYQH